MTFEFALETLVIREKFTAVHQNSTQETEGWTATATRQKLIADYWFRDVASHFAIMIGLSAILYFIISLPSFSASSLLPGILIATIISFPVLYFFHYKPAFGTMFLPRLETVKEVFEQKEMEQLGKCRKAQLPNSTLVLIHYVLGKASGMQLMQATDQFSSSLMKLYGVDPRSLKTSMDILLGSSVKRKKLQGRGRTEIANRFNEAYAFFEELNFLQGIEILKELELKSFGNSIT
jgi:hypothetical protein